MAKNPRNHGEKNPIWQWVKTIGTPVVHIKIAGKWMFIPLKMDVHPTKNCIFLGIDPYSIFSTVKSRPLLLGSFSTSRADLCAASCANAPSRALTPATSGATSTWNSKPMGYGSTSVGSISCVVFFSGISMTILSYCTNHSILLWIPSLEPYLQACIHWVVDDFESCC